MKKQYSETFRQEAVKKVYSRGNLTVEEIAEQLNVNPWTLKNWLKRYSNEELVKKENRDKRPQDWTAAERLQVLLDSQGLKEEALNAFCRERGLFPHHLLKWRQQFEQGEKETVQRDNVRALKERSRRLERELKRKEKALAEAAALLVLQKKCQALWEDEDV